MSERTEQAENGGRMTGGQLDAVEAGARGHVRPCLNHLYEIANDRACLFDRQPLPVMFEEIQKSTGAAWSAFTPAPQRAYRLHPCAQYPHSGGIVWRPRNCFASSPERKSLRSSWT